MDYSRQMTRQQYVRKRRRRRKIIMRRIIFVLSLLIIIGTIVGGIIFFMGRSLSGTFEREADITDRVSADMAVWLSDINDPEIDAEWVRSRASGYSIKEIMVLSDGQYTRSIDQDSYNKLTADVYSDLGRMLTEIIKGKLLEKGYKENMSDEETAQIATEILGMSISDYLKSSELPIILPIQELASSIFNSDPGMNEAGTYKVRGGKITVNTGSETISETIINKKGTLVFTESGKIYNEKK